MPATLAPVANPDVMTWEFKDKTGTSRTFEQSELTIDGEVRLIQLASEVVKRLNASGFPWDEAANVVSENGDWDFMKLQELLTLAVAELPELAAESTCIMFGLSPFNESGRRNPDYDTDKAFIRRSINISSWTAVLEKFIEQNDYRRLARPFGSALTKAMELGMTSQIQSRANNASSPESTFLSKADTDEMDVKSSPE